jgi:hypothetical protein
MQTKQLRPLKLTPLQRSLLEILVHDGRLQIQSDSKAWRTVCALERRGLVDRDAPLTWCWWFATKKGRAESKRYRKALLGF